jgi:dTDP-4-amino-4,6-dideoxygalactose transaminase
MAVHIYGQITIPQCNVADTVLIEDCAQAHGASMNGVVAGGFGSAATWSFYPTKNLGAYGDAGAITTNDKDMDEYAKTMRNYGTRSNSGLNTRFDPVQAAFLRVKLSYLSEFNSRRKENASTYLDTIARDGSVSLPDVVGEPCWHQFVIETDDRDNLRLFLHNNGISTMVHYPEVPYPDSFKILEAERWASRTLSLPVAPHVTPEQCRQIGELVNQWMVSQH